jgi:methylmalonyl-CoA/ethylmalonyl-CoA epimerase
MKNNILESQVVTQIGIVVKDIQKTAEAYANFFGVQTPKILLTENAEKTNLQYRGKASLAQAKLATFHLGSLQLDLIEPDEHPSMWREFLDQYGEGVLHIAFIVERMEEKISSLQQNGMPLIHKADFTGGKYAYIDTLKDLKVILEIMEFN